MNYKKALEKFGLRTLGTKKFGDRVYYTDAV